jgi:Protein of unknown function (DUF2384)
VVSTQKTVTSRKRDLSAKRKVTLPHKKSFGFSKEHGVVFKTFMDKDGMIVIDRVTTGFRMSKGQLAETVGLAPEALYKTGRVKAVKTQSRIIEMLEIINRVSDWAGGTAQAMAWYRAQPIPALGDRTAESLVKSGEAATVRDYLDVIASGGFA